MSFEKDLKKIDQRVWSSIKSKWMGHLPMFSYPGEAPLHDLSEFYGVEDLSKKATSSQGEHREEVQHLRTEVLREGIYLFHKASHVCKSGLVHLDNDFISWSLSSAYQSSFFSLKSLLCLLGLSFPRLKYNGKCLMIDCFPKGENLSKNQLKKGLLPRQEMKFVSLQNLQHHQYWEILQRVLRVTTIPFWDNAVINYLLDFEATDYAFQRNSLHYRNNFWLIPDDLFNRNHDPDFATFSDIKESLKSVNQHTNDFSFIISYLVLRMSYSLIRDLADEAPILAGKLELMDNFIQSAVNRRMLNSIAF